MTAGDVLRWIHYGEYVATWCELHPEERPYFRVDRIGGAWHAVAVDWRRLPVASWSLAYIHAHVRCVCGHDPSYHYDLHDFCMACMDAGGDCMAFADAPFLPLREGSCA